MVDLDIPFDFKKTLMSACFKFVLPVISTVVSASDVLPFSSFFITNTPPFAIV